MTNFLFWAVCWFFVPIKSFIPNCLFFHLFTWKRLFGSVRDDLAGFNSFEFNSTVIFWELSLVWPKLHSLTSINLLWKNLLLVTSSGLTGKELIYTLLILLNSHKIKKDELITHSVVPIDRWVIRVHSGVEINSYLVENLIFLKALLG